MLIFAEQLRSRSAGLRVLNLGGEAWAPHTPMGSMVFTVMAALAQMELKIKRARITDSVAKRPGTCRCVRHPWPPWAREWSWSRILH